MLASVFKHIAKMKSYMHGDLHSSSCSIKDKLCWQRLATSLQALLAQNHFNFI